MRLSLPIGLVFLAALGLLGSVSGRALTQVESEPTCLTDDCRTSGHRSLLVPIKPRADIFLGDVPPPHEGEPTSGESVSGNPAGGSSRGDPGSDGDPGLLTAGGASGPSTAGDRSASLPYDQYQNRGNQAISDLNRAIQIHKPDATYPDIKLGYKAWDDTPDKVTCDGLGAIFSDTDVGLNPKTEYLETEWESMVENPNLPHGESSIVNWSLYNPGEKAIVVKEMDSSKDTLPAGDSQKLPASEIMWQLWVQQAGAGKGNLRVVNHETVNNQGTKDTINAAYVKNGLDATRAKGDFGPDGLNINRNDAFQALLGTDNVRPTVYMLTDHHQELGDKQVQRIFTYPPGYGGGTSDGWTVAIIMW